LGSLLALHHATYASSSAQLPLLRRNNQPGVKKPVAFLAHGVTLASDSFAILDVNESMAFVLADAGELSFHACFNAGGSSQHPVHEFEVPCIQRACSSSHLITMLHLLPLALSSLPNLLH
jgi:hypothetical protein